MADAPFTARSPFRPSHQPGRPKPRAVGRNEVRVRTRHLHGYRFAYRMAGKLPLETPRDFKVYNASINRFRVDGGELVLDSWGEVAHLRPALIDELG